VRRVVLARPRRGRRRRCARGRLRQRAGWSRLAQDWAWISIVFLAALGLLNLAAVLGTPADRVVEPVGIRGRVFARLTRTSHPAAIALVGTLFAISFDTLFQAALFALTANQFGGWEHALVLGMLFMLGMALADGANGFWIAALLKSADAAARVASRVLGLAVAGLSLGVAAFAAAQRHSPTLAAWADGRELAVSAGVFACIAALSSARSRPADGGGARQAMKRVRRAVPR
jgi:high-affinity nickel-transport protein